MKELRVRLDLIRDRVTSSEFLHGQGLGNEVPFYAFDYPPAEEPLVASHIEWLVNDLTRKTDLRIANVHLLKLVIEQLRTRGIYEKALVMEQTKGVLALLGAMKGPLEPRKLAESLLAKFPPQSLDMIFLTGVGAAYPFIRTHSLLNNLQPLIGKTPVVLFFPGRFNGQSLQLFGELQETPYYRAFKLVD